MYYNVYLQFSFLLFVNYFLSLEEVDQKNVNKSGNEAEVSLDVVFSKEHADLRRSIKEAEILYNSAIKSYEDGNNKRADELYSL